MSEPSNTTFAQQNVMGRYDICNGNHPRDYCEYNYNPGWQFYQNPSWYEEPSHFPSNLPSTYDFHQKPEPSEEYQVINMLIDWIKKQDERMDTILEIFQNQFESFQSQTTSIRRLTNQMSN